jgi:NADH dehydrogenase [ubiquinone] 1 alpha subcomplex assembly factor 7
MLLPERLARAITLAGPIPLAQYMAAANGHYYATRDPLGSAGDFTTAPEISQMFGELVGLWLADLWTRAGKPAAHYVELGPGRGTLASDALRAARVAGFAPPVHFVETSPVLREAQRERHPDASWHDDVATLPGDGALMIVANEFFDALPIRQLVRTGADWRERLVACQDTLFLPIAGGTPLDMIVPPHLRDAPPGSIIETAPAAVAIMRGLAERIAAQGGAAIVVDYGYEGPALGDTLQAVKGHGFANPFEQPGEHDLTAHVDFATLAAAALAGGARVHGPVGQGDWLRRLGVTERAETLKKAQPDQSAAVEAARDRLVEDDQMGTLFKAMASVAPGWPDPAGFDG